MRDGMPARAQHVPSLTSVHVPGLTIKVYMLPTSHAVSEGNAFSRGIGQDGGRIKLYIYLYNFFKS